MSEAPANEIATAEVKGGVTPYLSVDGATKASAFYQKAFAAKLEAQHPPDEQGRTMHIHLHINGSSIMLADFYPEQGHGYEKPQGFNLTLQVTDIETWWKRAIDAGCTPVLEPQTMFWGDTYAQCTDPFGVMWAMNQRAG